MTNPDISSSSLGSSTDSRLYIDDASLMALTNEPRRDRVVLIGSYLGYANFGDIAQAKGAIAWHRENTGLAPVLVCATDAITDSASPARIRRWMGVDAVVFVSESPMDLTVVGLDPLPPTEAWNLHLYGGGALNRFWGRTILSITETLLRHFGVGHIVISGQQVDREFASEFKAFIEQTSPAIVGCRDRESVEHMRAVGVATAFSFDDAWEILNEFAARSPRPSSAAPGCGPVLLHLNASRYVFSDDGAEVAVDGHGQATDSGVRGAMAAIRSIVEAVALFVEQAENPHELILLQAYTDRRVLDIVDSIGVVQQLETHFPFESYRVVQLDTSMLNFQPGASEDVVSLPRDASLTVACSYHVSMLSSILEVPCWLYSSNEFYDQKRTSLGLFAGALSDFLSSPTGSNFSDHAKDRQVWLRALQEAYDIAGATPVKSSEPTVHRSAGEDESHSPAPTGQVKGFPLATAQDDRDALVAAAEWQRIQHENWKEAANQLQHDVDHLRQWIDQLQAAKDYHEQQARNLRGYPDERE